MTPQKNQEDPMKSIASRMRLKEGEEAIRRVLTSIHRSGKIGTKDIAKDARLPIPVTAAIRRELEKEGLVARKGGAILTTTGKYYVASSLGLSEASLTSPDNVEGEYTNQLHLFQKIMVGRPPASPELDQVHATPETSLKRARYMKENGDLDGRKILFLGDDDLTSIASSILGSARKIAVLDVDVRLVDYISNVSADNNLKIECIEHDLRDPLPEEHLNKYDVFITDPPYTVEGLKLFLSRGLQSLRPRKTANAYFSFADKPPLEMLKVNRALNDMGMYISELIPRFNTYIGAEIFANTTSIYRVTVTEEATPTITGFYNGKMYTAEVQPRLRYYGCRCGKQIKIGPKEMFTTIKLLKEAGCPNCNAHEGFRLRKRVNVKK